MPHIIVRSPMIPHAQGVQFQHTTYIEFHVENASVTMLQALIEYRLLAQRLQSANALYLLYMAGKPPYEVLDFLETKAGYKVVASSAVRDTCIWTLHKPEA